VGEVAAYALDDDGQSLTLKVFFNAPPPEVVVVNTGSRLAGM